MAKHSANHHAERSADKSADKSAEIGDSHRPLALTSPKQRQGSHFERQACEFLQAQGLVLIAQNWQQPKVGELDLIMLETGQAWSTLVFIEVRQRQQSGFGDAALSVTASKQRKIIKTAKHFLNQHPKYANYDCRFDVIAYDFVQTAKNINTPRGYSRKSDSVKNNSGGDKTLNHSNTFSPKNHEIKNNQIESCPINNNLINAYPEWLVGAFIATAW